MKRFYVVTNRRKDEGLALTETVRDFLEAHGCTCAVHIYDWNPQSPTVHYTDEAQIPEGTECILVLGGDGSLIQTANDVIGRSIPLLGINLGNMGFLAEADKDSVLPALKRLIADDFEVKERMMLRGQACVGGNLLPAQHALNDVVITRTGPLHIIRFNVYVNGEPLNVYQADGIILSTPTGSTGYNMSAGGPIVSPDAHMLLMTPICAHTLNTRSIVLSSTDTIRIEIGPGRRESVEITAVTFDGSRELTLRSGDYIEVCRAERATRFIKLNKDSFLEVLRKKMSETE